MKKLEAKILTFICYTYSTSYRLKTLHLNENFSFENVLYGGKYIFLYKYGENN